ncbi:hypothetical protein [Aurantimicrobium minutum]|uniref:hypothetical protein n=1 Tax=Aurantimicrobium minutum TaxID=708131 RepID=UPI002473786E|nr:hypothetical protein [Aurantimicrobium minutum]MDH6256039.1 hypothetical protein [Aurantimicrobium minutum]
MNLNSNYFEYQAIQKNRKLFILHLALAAVFLVSIIWVTFRTKSQYLVSLEVFAGLAVSAVFTTLVQKFIDPVPQPLAFTVIGLSFLVVAFWLSRKRINRKFEFSYISALPVFSFLLALSIIVAKAQSWSLNNAVFSGIGRLAFAEDNAKWVNFSANVAQGNDLYFNDGTGGALAVIIVLTSVFVAIFSELVLGGPNVVGITVQTIICVQAVLLVLAPLALTPVLMNFRRNMYVEQGFDQVFFQRNIGIFVGTLFSAAGLSMGIVATTAMGHLSFAVIILQLSFWATCVLYNWPMRQNWLLITVIGSSQALVWLPLPALSVAIAIAGLFFGAIELRKQRTWARIFTLIGLAINLIVLVWLMIPSVTYLASSTSTSTSIHLVIAEGGTLAPKKADLFIFALLVIGCLLLCFENRKTFNWKHLIRVYPVMFILGFAVAVAVYDYLVAPIGWPHYGSRKLGYGAILISSVVIAPIGISGFFQKVKFRWLLAPIAIAALVITYSFTYTSFYFSTGLFMPSSWSSSEIRANDGKVQTEHWINKVNPRNEQLNSLEGYPIGCIKVKNGVIVQELTDQYICTRFLISVNALENSSTALVWPFTSSANTDIIDRLDGLPIAAKSHPFMVINDDGDVVGVVSFDEYMKIYQGK